MKRLSVKEILGVLKYCDGLLETYKKTIQPAARELARRKSEYVFRKKGPVAYKGELGCWEVGISTVCLHIKPWALGKTYARFEKKVGNRPSKFEKLWGTRAAKAGIRNVRISGHF